jgi:hypothetical protein
MSARDAAIAGGALLGRQMQDSLMEPLSAMINKRLIIPSQKTNYIAVETHYLSQILRNRIGEVFVDERWYISQYPDVVDSLSGGDLSTASDHYSLHGYYEHRMPYAIMVDEPWYVEEYKDIALAVKAGVFASGQAHFDIAGYREGRIPYPHFRLKLRGKDA